MSDENSGNNENSAGSKSNDSLKGVSVDSSNKNMKSLLVLLG